jgi:hypothetical protein
MRAGVGPNFIVVSVYVYTNSAYAHALHSADDFFDRAVWRDWRNQFALPSVRAILKGSEVRTYATFASTAGNRIDSSACDAAVASPLIPIQQIRAFLRQIKRNPGYTKDTICHHRQV